MSLRRHTVYNILGAILPIGVSLLTVPAYLHQVGSERFGILSVAWLLLGYFGLLDLGLGMATAQQIAARARDGPATQVRIFWTALTINSALGLLGGLIAWPAAYAYFAHVMKLSPVLRVEVLASIPWLILAVPTATITGVATGSLQGLNRFGALNIISVAGTVLFQALPLAAAYFWSPSLTVVLPVALLARALTLAMLAVENHRRLLRGHSITYAKSEARKLLRFGVWVTIPCFFVPLLSMIDRFAIGAVAGAGAVTYYVIPFNLGERLTILGNSLGAALFPRFSALSNEQASELGLRSERSLIALMLLVILGAMFAMDPFLRIWIGADFAPTAASIGQVLLIGFWFDSVSRVPLYGLRGQSRPEVVAKIEIAQLVPFWIFLFAMMKFFGVLGVAYAYVFRVAMNYLLLAGWFGTLRRVWPFVIVGAVLLIGSAGLISVTATFERDWFVLLFAAAILSLAYAWWVLPSDARERALAWFRRSHRPSSEGGARHATDG